MDRRLKKLRETWMLKEDVSSDRNFWIDENGKPYMLKPDETHTMWALRNIPELQDDPMSIVYTYLYMLDRGWTRAIFEYSRMSGDLILLIEHDRGATKNKYKVVKTINDIVREYNPTYVHIDIDYDKGKSASPSNMKSLGRYF